MIEPVVLVHVRGNKFSYYNHIEGLAYGDTVLVPFGASFQVGMVAGVPETEKQRNKATKWIVQRIMGPEVMEKWNALTALRPPPEEPKVSGAARALDAYRKAKKASILPAGAGKTIKFRRPQPTKGKP